MMEREMPETQSPEPSEPSTQDPTPEPAYEPDWIQESEPTEDCETTIIDHNLETREQSS